MEAENDNSNSLDPAAGCLSNLAQTVLGGGIVLLGEYIFFQGSLLHIFFEWLNLILWLITLVALVITYYTYRSNMIVRELYASLVFFVALCWTIASFASLISIAAQWEWTTLLPWHAVPKIRLITQVITLFLVIPSSWVFWKLRRSYTYWQGPVSVAEVQRQQQYSSATFLENVRAGFKYLLLHRRPELAPYVPPAPVTLTYKGEHRIRSWSEVARTLVVEIRPALDFRESNWHAESGCWIGTDRLSERVVLLFPVEHKVALSRLPALYKMGLRVADGQARGFASVIAVVRGNYDGSTQISATLPCIFVTEQQLLRSLTNLTIYRSIIQQRVTAPSYATDGSSLLETYVEPNIIDLDGKQCTFRAYVYEWLAMPAYPILSVLGGQGQGKTSTALMYTFAYLAQDKDPSARLPLYIDLRGKSLCDKEPSQ